MRVHPPARFALLLVPLSVVAGAWLVDPAVRVDLDHVLAPPSAAHPLGTDHLGRDLAARLAAGARPSVQAAAAALAGALGLGLAAGAAMSLGPGWVRAALEGLADLALALPTLVVALLLAGALGGGPLVIGGALAITAWAPYALVVAQLSDRVRHERWWLAARALGVTGPGGFARHILPAIAPRVGALAGADAGRAVVLAASLGFLGLGTDAGRPCWGGMIHDYRMFLFSHPRLVLAPVMALALMSLALHLALDRPDRPGGATPG
jgi:ABC-type dipeptide/oligopeptide/nickel transport system permease subunit